MSQPTIAPSGSAFHQQVEEVLSYQPNHPAQMSLALPRFHFGDALAAALHDQQVQWERREQRHDRAEIERAERAEQEDAAENERQWRQALRDLKLEIGGEL
jgi:hypothetical protein